LILDCQGAVSTAWGIFITQTKEIVDRYIDEKSITDNGAKGIRACTAEFKVCETNLADFRPEGLAYS